MPDKAREVEEEEVTSCKRILVEVPPPPPPPLHKIELAMSVRDICGSPNLPRPNGRASEPARTLPPVEPGPENGTPERFTGLPQGRRARVPLDMMLPPPLNVCNIVYDIR
jgi:hypothetical protein